MKFIDYIKSEIKFFNISERIFYSIVILSVILISILTKDSKIALISAICGITYTLFAGKGKVYCYYIGLAGTFLYCLIAYKNGFYGNMALYGLYFFPMQLIGIFKWKQHLNKEKNEIFKTKLNNKERIVYLIITALITFLIYEFLKLSGGENPIMDSFVTGFSVLGQFLTVKRCIEQWYIWSFVNLASVIMWLIACINGAHYYATLIMWLIYLGLGIYFYFKWKKEI